VQSLQSEALEAQDFGGVLALDGHGVLLELVVVGFPKVRAHGQLQESLLFDGPSSGRYGWLVRVLRPKPLGKRERLRVEGCVTVRQLTKALGLKTAQTTTSRLRAAGHSLPAPGLVTREAALQLLAQHYERLGSQVERAVAQDSRKPRS
jgi:hypothetical protein